MSLVTKRRSKGRIAILNDTFRFVFHCLESERNSFKERSIISTTVSMLLNEERASLEDIPVRRYDA